MTKPILIIGGGPAGLAAAHSLGTIGRDSVLIEKEDRLGGAPILSGYAKLVPSGEWAKDAIGGMVTRVEDDERVQVETGATVTSFDGTPGNFVAELSNGKKIDAEAAMRLEPRRSPSPRSIRTQKHQLVTLLCVRSRG